MSDVQTGGVQSSDEKRRMLAELLRKKAGPRTVPASFSQQRVWFLAQMEPDSAAYNVPLAFELSGPLDPRALEQALAEVVRRHGGLRTRFDVVDGEPVQVVEPGVAFRLEHEDVSGVEGDAAARRDEARARAARVTAEPMDLTRVPLLRARLFHLGPEHHLLLVLMHHIIMDGWSQKIVHEEMLALYGAFAAGRPSPLEPPRLQYADFAAWQRQQLSGDALDAQLAFWKGMLAGAPALLELPTDRPRPPVESHEGASLLRGIVPEGGDALRALTRGAGATPFMLFLAAYAVLLGRWSGQDAVVVGTPIAGRTRQELEGTVGFFANTLAVRVELGDDPTFRELLDRVRETMLGAYAHQDLPFERLVDELKTERSLAYSPVYQVMYTYSVIGLGGDGPNVDAPVAGVKFRTVHTAGANAVADLMLTMADGGEGYSLKLDYRPALFDEATVSRMAEQFSRLMDGIGADPDRPVSSYSLLTDGDRHLVLHDWSRRESAARTDGTVQALFEAQADRTPDAVAVVFGAESLTYRELDTRATRLAHHLRGLGVGPDVRVGVSVERSVEMAVAVLAVLKAGGCYVAMDPGYPAERLAYMLASSRAPVLLTQSHLADRLPYEGATVVRLDADWECIAAESAERFDSGTSAENLAYVLYTSGSTGQPKGVALPQRALVNLLHWQLAKWEGQAPARTLQFASLSFDVSFQEIFSTWCSGGALVLVDEDTRRDADALFALLREHDVERLFLPFAALQHLAEVAETVDLDGMRLREIITAGEQLRSTPTLKSLVERTGCVLENQYGPTESHVVSAYTMAAETAGWPMLPPIGAPIDAVSLFVLDGAMQPQPVGVPGELYIGGAGLARGYLGRPALTAERFVPDPLGAAGARLYRTGDRVRWTADGTLQFQGRIDEQVKVRGFRIELGEIEAVLQQHPAVSGAAVAVREDSPGDRRIVGYVTAAEGEVPDAAALREQLRATLPEFMVPSVIVVLDALPLSPNGKVDRRALPAPDPAAAEARYEAPRTETERALAAIWSEVLKVEPVGRTAGFFDLGGHSLMATRVVSRVRQVMGREVPVRALFEAPTLAALAARIDASGADAGDALPPLVPAVRGERIPLSFAQERLWLVDRLVPGSAAYNLPVALPLPDAADEAVLERVLTEVVRRHEALRTVFREDEGGPVQVVLPAAACPLRVVDAADDDAAARGVHDAMHLPFDLERGPLFRATLVRAPGGRTLVLAMHHIVGDGWSLDVLGREVEALYAAFAAGAPSPLAPLPVQYADFTLWQRGWLRGETLERQMAFWRERLAGAPALLELPTDRPRPAVQSFRGAGETVWLPRRLVRGLEALSRREGTTLFATLLAAFDVLLARLSGQDDVVVGVPVAGRNRAETEGLIGFFVNNLVLRADLSGDPAFRALLARTHEAMLAAQAHQDVPFERLVDEVRAERSLSHSPLFQVTLNLQNTADAPVASLAGEGDDAEPDLPTPPVSAAKFDLALAFSQSPAGMVGVAEYSTDLFERATIRRILAQLRALLEEVVARPEAPVSTLALAAGSERARLVDEWSGRATEYPRDASVPALFARVASSSPSSVAVTAHDGTLTYAELDARANRLARHLRSAGVRAGDRVGLSLPRSSEVPVALLAILKAGAAYVPLDPEYPAERLAGMCADAGVQTLVVADGVPDALASFSGTVVSLAADRLAIDAEPSDEPTNVTVGPESLAYVVFTSGSTGRPKGVAVPHRAVVRLVRGTDYAEFGPDEVVLQLAPVAFDASTLEVWAPLLNGARLAIHPPQTPSLEELGRFIQEQGVTTAWLTAGLFHQMVDSQLDALRGVRQLLAGGDVLSVPHVRRALDALPGTRIINGYGPTENTTFTCCHTVRAEDVERASIPIGRPIANTHVYVLDAAMQPVPVGVPGELYAGGDGVALGYLGQPELTAERFVADPFSADGGKLYRTGDRVRWLADGTLEFLGRIDAQVKVRGFRIEPGEVEAALLSHPAVEQAVATVREDVPGDRRLVAYVVPRGEVEPTELRTHLRARLPEYMVPSAVVVLDALPLTPNGKVDRRALPAPDAPADGEAYVPPRTATERALAAIWGEVLSVERVSAGAQFFELGGHSLLATRVVSRIRQGLGVELPLRALFEEPVLADLARRIDEARAEAPAEQVPPLVAVPRDRPLPLSFAQERLWFVDRLVPGNVAYNLPVVLPLPDAVDVGVLERALGEIVRRHEALRTVFAAGEAGPVQVVLPASDGFRMEVADLSTLPAGERAAAAARRVAEEYNRPFDLERGPLFRATLVRGDGVVLVLNMHHVVSDGWSMNVLTREVNALYDAFSRGAPSPLPPLPVQYADFAVWQRAHLSGAVLERQLAYWRERLAGAPALLEVPTDRPRPAVQGFNGSMVPLFLPRAAADGLAAVAASEGATPFMALLAAFSAVLGRWAGQEDVVVGSPIAGRNRAEIEGLIGFFVNTLVLRTDLSGDPTFRELLGRTREVTLGAYAHQEVPFERLVEELSTERSLAHSPLFQVMFALENTGDTAAAGGPALDEAALEDDGAAGPHATAKFDLTLNLSETGAGVLGGLEFNTDLFDRATARRLARHFRALVEAAAARPDVPLSRLDVLPAEERGLVVRGWNDAARRDFASDGTRIHDLFAAQAARTPDAVALVFGDAELTYAELNARANHLARRLQGLGVGPDVPVAVCMERRPEMIVALLAVLKAGGAYVPVDPAYPAERIAFMLEDTGAPVVLASATSATALPATTATTVRVDAEWEEIAALDPSPVDSAATAESLAYVIYTSGSTGRPKGVAIEHRSTVTLLHWLRETVSDEERRLALASTSISFDVSVAEIFGTLCWGGTLVLVENALSLAEEKRAITYASMVPSAAAELLRMGALPASLRLLLLGGEPVPHALARAVHGASPATRLGNGYGPTEDTTYSTVGWIDAGAERVHVGRPVANTQAYVLDRHLQPVPVGVPGELYLAGDGVTRGYFRRPGLTAERYLPNPFSVDGGGRMYRVGDRVRWLPDGTLEYLGRLDQQVKVRGFRIETGEIEAALASHANVREAVVTAHESATAGTRLVAYVVARDGSSIVDAAELRAHLRTRLPEYMVPSAIVRIDAMPLTPNGKTDRRALPAPVFEGDEGAEFVAPRTATEEAVAAVWREVLGVARVGATDNFFALGGHSLLATQVVSRIRTALGVELPLRAAFEAPTVAELAARVDAARTDGAAPKPRTGGIGKATARRMVRGRDGEVHD